MKKILTIVFDGFGYREESEGNAIKLANLHTYNKFFEENPHTLLYASEERIGLLKGQMGNSEVGHMTIGAGRKLKSNTDNINDFFTGDKSENSALIDLLKDKDKSVHIMGLCSDGKIHSNIDDFLSMFKLLKDNNFTKVFFHLITDGRDTKIDSAYSYISQIEDKIKEYKIGSISTICGRYYAMDRDKNYDRTKIYYDLITKGVGLHALKLEPALKNCYSKGVTDEFMKPILLNEKGLIKNGDSIIWMNFRNDRAKQILSTFTNESFSEFKVNPNTDISVYSFFNIDKSISTKVFIGEKKVENALGLYLSKLGLKQARVAESEKYAHVTYFFDGGYNGKIFNCDKFHIPSPEVATYDLKPEMSAINVTKKIIDSMENDYDFIFANFANPDMVGHTGNMEATIKACITLDICLSKIIESAEDNFYTIFLLADHGNADYMINEDGTPCTTHSLSKVPFIVNDPSIKLANDGDLTNIAPTILDYMDISIPEQMESSSLIIKE